jgi:hypothetical protein
MEIRFGTTRGQFAKMRDTVGAELRPEPRETAEDYWAEPSESRYAHVNGTNHSHPS